MSEEMPDRELSVKEAIDIAIRAIYFQIGYLAFNGPRTDVSKTAACAILTRLRDSDDGRADTIVTQSSLLAAVDAVIDAWEHGDLAGAVNRLADAKNKFEAEYREHDNPPEVKHAAEPDDKSKHTTNCCARENPDYCST